MFVNINNNLFAQANSLIYSMIGLNAIIANNISGYNPLFVDPNNSDFHLMDARRIAPGTTNYFKFTSKAAYNPSIGQIPGDDTRDLGCYGVTYTLVSDTWETTTFKDGMFNGSTKINHKLANFQGSYDVDGDANRSIDGLKRHIEMVVDNNSFVGTYGSMEYTKISKAVGAKRWYPFGFEGIFSVDNSTVTANLDGAGNPTGDFNATLPTLPYPLQIHYYEGFWCELTLISDPTKVYYMRISDNLGYNLTIFDQRGTQATFVAGNYLLKCQYLAVEIMAPEMEMDFPLWAGKGNALYPQTNFAGSNDVSDTARNEGHVRTIIMEESKHDL